MVETNSRMLPRLLDGVWTTDAPQYSDAFLELSPTFVITVVGREQPARIQFVDKVRVVSEGSKTLLTVHSTDIAEHTEETLVLDFRPDNGGELRLGHQPHKYGGETCTAEERSVRVKFPQNPLGELDLRPPSISPPFFSAPCPCEICPCPAAPEPRRR
jgi:hypothetical protein